MRQKEYNYQYVERGFEFEAGFVTKPLHRFVKTVTLPRRDPFPR